MNEYLMIGIVVLVMAIVVFFTDHSRKGCDCEACKRGESGWMTEEYANRYPDCKYNIRNRV